MARWLAKQGCEVEAVDAAPEMLRVAEQLTSHGSGLLPITFRRVDTIERLSFLDKASTGYCAPVFSNMSATRTLVLTNSGGCCGRMECCLSQFPARVRLSA